MSAAVLVLVCLAQPVLGVDLSKIDRTLTKEPAYETKKPKYCLLVFGPQARTRVWLVLDGKVLYADRTGKGDLTGPDKRLKNLSPKNPKVAHFRTGPILAADGKTRYPDVLVLFRHEGRINKPVRVVVQVFLPKAFNGTRAERQRISEESELQFADRPQDAPILHIDGPLSLRLEDPKQVFVRGAKPSSLPVLIGTPGLGKRTYASLVFESDAPAAVATIAFPSRKAAGKPIVIQVPLKPPT
jgi:hypothetical protein